MKKAVVQRRKAARAPAKEAGLLTGSSAPKEATPTLESEIGAEVRRLRKSFDLTVSELGVASGISSGMLSKIENDRAVPSLTTLHRLCKALNLSVSALLNKDFTGPWTILRPAERAVIGHASGSGSEGVRAEVIIPHADGRLLEGFVVIIEPGGHTAGVLQHQGEEVGYVMEGQLELTINREVHLLNAGDSFYFPSDLPHEYRNPGKTRMRAVWINTPPTF